MRVWHKQSIFVENVTIKNMRHIIFHNAAIPQFANFVEQTTLSGISPSAQVIYKGRNKVYCYAHPCGNVNIKAFRRPGLLNSLIYTTFRKSKAQRSFEYANRLIQMGFHSPTPIGYGEERKGLRLMRSYYFSEQLEAQNMRDWELKADCEPLLRALAQEMVKLHRAGVWHKDFSPGNILYTGNATDGYTFYYIDLNRMEFDVTNRCKLMSMFRAINLSPIETERIARHYAEAAGENPEEIVRIAVGELNNYLASKRRHRLLKKLFRRKKKK